MADNIIHVFPGKSATVGWEKDREDTLLDSEDGEGKVTLFLSTEGFRKQSITIMRENEIIKLPLTEGGRATGSMLHLHLHDFFGEKLMHDEIMPISIRKEMERLKIKNQAFETTIAGLDELVRDINSKPRFDEKVLSEADKHEKLQRAMTGILKEYHSKMSEFEANNMAGR